MARDLNFPIEVVICPIVREADGLAMSSRNAYLSPAERQAAVVLSRALFSARDAFAAGERSPSRLRQIVSDAVNAEPLARLQYVSCADAGTLEELEGAITRRTLLSMAVYFGKTRLIDNLILDP
jgi:pantoate--beta-alanine ligase